MPDWTSPRPPKVEFVPDSNSNPEFSAMARPLDRLAAAIIDIFILLIPIYVLVSAPLKKALTSSFILGAEGDFVGAIVLMVLVAVSLILCYQSVFHYFFNATIGKMLFDLRVRPVFPEQRLGFMACFGRSFFWICELLLLGVPMLAVFSNRQRRPLHDRISDTYVATLAKSGVLAPQSWERGLVRGFMGACVLFAVMIVTLQTRLMVDKLKHERGLAAVIEHEASDCEVVSRHVSEDEDDIHARLNIAMTLYAAGLAERNCLEAEVEREMSKQIPAGAITYLAQAFVNADDAQVSNAYLDQVCEDAPNTVECSMSKVVNRWSEDDWDSVESLLATSESGSGFLEVWAIRHFMKQANYGQALTYLNTLSDHPAVADFTLVQRVKALYNSYLDSEAEAALAQTLPVLPKEDSEELSAWMCAQQLQNGCGALEKLACRSVPNQKDLNEIDFQHPSIALTRVMALECQGEQSMDYLTFSEAVHDEDWRNFFRANLKHQKTDNHAAYKLFAEVIASNSTPELLRIEAVRRLAQFGTRQQIASVVEMWRGFESKETWIKSGNLLLTRFVNKKDRDSAMKLARDLMNSEAISPRALALLGDFSRDASQTERKPASVKAKDDVKLYLDSYEEEQ